jgi:hypothetical protein
LNSSGKTVYRLFCEVLLVSLVVNDVSEELKASITADAYTQICPDVLILHAPTLLLTGSIRLTRGVSIRSDPARVCTQRGTSLTIFTIPAGMPCYDKELQIVHPHGAPSDAVRVASRNASDVVEFRRGTRTDKLILIGPILFSCLRHYTFIDLSRS